MAAEFVRTVRALGADRSRLPIVWFSAIGAVVLLFVVWLVLARVVVYRTSETSRLEVNDEAHPLSSPVGGHVSANQLVLGRQVAAGELLIELDSQAQRIALDEQRAKTMQATAHLGALRAQLDAEQQAGRDAARSSESSVESARARLNQAQTAAKLQAAELDRLKNLHANHMLSEIDLMHANADYQRKLDETRVLRAETLRSQAELSAVGSDRTVKLEGLRAQISQLEGELAASTAASRGIEYDISLRSIRAPIDGRVAEVDLIPVGAMISQGQRLASIVPLGEVRIISQFRPEDALGRVQVGQEARFRVDGFPWAQYGTVTGHVTTVGSEPRDGRIRVELSLIKNPRIPIQHGLTGQVEIEVERVRPVLLVLRAAGQVAAGPIDNGSEAASTHPSAATKPAER